MGGISLMLFSMIALVGVKTIKNEGVKLNKTNLILMASIIFVGLSGLVLSEPIGIKISDAVSISGLSLAALVGVILNLIITKFESSKSRKEVIA